MSTSMFGLTIILCFLSIFCFCVCTSGDSKIPPYQVKYFEQNVDHFNEMSHINQTFEHKYLYSDEYWTVGSGPIFYYTGDEVPVVRRWETSGFIFELASEFKALVVLAEHGYFGSSMPFGKDSLEAPNIGLLSFEQTLADNAVLLSHIVRTHNCTHCKVIAVGGSYGAMIATYMRLKYPNLVMGALASSGTMAMQDPSGRRDLFFAKVTQDFRDASETCVDCIIKAFAVTKELSEDETALRTLSDSFRLCEPLKNHEDYIHFLGWIRQGITILAMMDYPYAASAFGDLPAYPVNTACKEMNAADNLVEGLRDITAIYYNNTKKLHCFTISDGYMPCADTVGCLGGHSTVSWDYLACTELWLPEGSNGVTDMFPNPPWDDRKRAEYCLKRFGVQPNHEWPFIQYWGKNLKAASNIVFSNGDLDPYGTGGTMGDGSDTVVTIEVKGGAHEVDFMGTNKADTPGITEARQKEREILRKWIDD